MEKIKVGVVGATGYAGAEICRLIYLHPAAELAAISSVSFEGMAQGETVEGVIAALLKQLPRG